MHNKISSSSKRKLILTLPFLTGGGAERVASDISIALSDYFDVYLVLTENKVTYPYKGTLINLNIPTSLKRNIFGYFIYEFLYTIKLFFVKQKLGNPPTISFMETANVPNILSLGFPITSIHEYKPLSRRTFRKDLSEVLMKILYNFSYMNVAVSKVVEKSLRDIYKIKSNKVVTIYNSINIKRIQKLKNEPLSEDEKKIFKHPVIITSGRLTYQKAQWRLIRSFKEVKKTVKDAKLVILGEGELRDDLIKFTKSLNLEKDVYFLGFKKNPFKYISKSSLFVLSSFYEGFSMVIAESMACGVPIVSIDSPAGPRELLDPKDYNSKIKGIKYGKYGILTERFENLSEDLNSFKLLYEERILAEAIIKILTNKKLSKHYSKMSLIRAKDFDIDKIKHEWLRLLNF